MVACFLGGKSRETHLSGHKIGLFLFSTRHIFMLNGTELFSELGRPVVGMGQLGGKLCSADVQKMTTARKMAASGGKDILSVSLPEISRDKILSDFPLHWHVWHKDSSSLEEELALNKVCVRAYFVDSVLTASRQNTINSFSPSVCGLYAAR